MKASVIPVTSVNMLPQIYPVLTNIRDLSMKELDIPVISANILRRLNQI